MSEEKRKKVDFVEKTLQDFIKSIDDNIESVSYNTVDTASYELEYVLLLWHSGYERRVYIDGNDHAAIARDVLRIF
jgi:hypothetical protein